MSLDTHAAIKQIDAALSHFNVVKGQSKYDDLSDFCGNGGLAELTTMLRDVIQRFAPPGSVYRQQADVLLDEHGPENLHRQWPVLVGVVKALRTAYGAGYLETIQQLVHADLFADFLDRASYLLSEGYKDPAAVLAGGVLEEGLRKLAVKNGVDIVMPNGDPRKSSSVNDDLAKRAVYDKLEQKTITAWLDLRNKAAHGKYTEFDSGHVDLMIQSVRMFLKRYPA